MPCLPQPPLIYLFIYCQAPERDEEFGASVVFCNFGGKKGKNKKWNYAEVETVQVCVYKTSLLISIFLVQYKTNQEKVLW